MLPTEVTVYQNQLRALHLFCLLGEGSVTIVFQGRETTYVPIMYFYTHKGHREKEEDETNRHAGTAGKGHMGIPATLEMTTIQRGKNPP